MKPLDEIAARNREAWNQHVAQGNRWTRVVDEATVARARAGEIAVVLTPTRPVPSDWLGELRDRDVLGLASAGGQQCPLFSAAGARVVSFDNSPAQLRQDESVAEREGLDLSVELGDMRDLSRFEDARFDLVFCPVSHVFIPDVRPVWREAFRVLRPGGSFLCGCAQPIIFCFDPQQLRTAEAPQLCFPLPYSDLEALPPDRLETLRSSGEPLVFGQTLEVLLGGQIEAGFALTGFYEDEADPHSEDAPLERYFRTYFATRGTVPVR